jgi:ADP-heptose:LPS heptosyltransferase
MKIKLIKLLDRLVGGMATAALPPAELRAVPAIRSALFIRPGGIGDAVLLVPALKALKAAYPGCRIEILAEKRNAAAFRLCSGVEAVHCYDTCGGIAAALRGGYDLVVDTEQWYRLSAVVARIIGASVSVGFATNGRKRLFSHPVPYPQEEYEAWAFLRLLAPLGIAVPPAIAVPFLELPATAAEAAQRLLEPLAGRPFVTLFPGASVPEKQWGVAKFRELAASLASTGIATVIVGGKDAVPAAREIATVEGALSLAGACSLAVSAAVVEKGRALVTGDSGLLHIAVGLGTPTIALFGPSDPVKWGGRGGEHVVLTGGLSCAPCSRFGTVPSCPKGGECLAAVTVGEVEAAVRKLLAGGRQPEPSAQ